MKGLRAVLVLTSAYGLIFVVSIVPTLIWPEYFGFKWYLSAFQEALIGVVTGASIALISLVFSRWTKAGRDLAARLKETLLGFPWWGIPVLAISSGVVEEVLFRGAIFSIVEELGGTATAAVLTSLFFGSCHGFFIRGFRAWSMFALGAGLVLAIVKVQTGSLLAPIVAHTVVNIINLPAIILNKR